MNDIRDRIEHNFGEWGKIVTAHPWKVIASFILFCSALFSQLGHLEIDTSNEAFLHKDNPIRLAYDDFRHQFGRDERGILLIETDNSIYSTVFFKRLASLHDDLENNALKIHEVTSLINARHTYGANDELLVEDLFEQFPQTQADLDRIKHIIKTNPIYHNNLVGDAENTTLIMIETDTYQSGPLISDDELLMGFDDDNSPTAAQSKSQSAFLTGEDNHRIVVSIDAIIAKHQRPDFRIHAAGTPHMTSMLMHIIMDDMTKFTLLGILAIAPGTYLPVSSCGNDFYAVTSFHSFYPVDIFSDVNPSNTF